MTAHDPNLSLPPRGILRWLRRRSDAETPDPGELIPLAAPAPSRHDALLADIGEFLLRHKLDANAFTLSVACDVVTGSDTKLARLIEKRVAGGRPVSEDWLERNAGRGAAALEAMMERLASSIEQFSTTTTAARAATSEYSSALQEHVGELEQVSKAGMVISELATIARAMLDRTREIERQMSESEEQTRTLQENLEKARREAEHDHLTGLPNRRAFEAAFERELHLAEENGEPLCVAFCDIDHFKRINDQHGHDAGDRVIKSVAQSLAAISNDRCHVARHGGEEFVVLLRGRTLRQAFELLDDARLAMGERRLVNRATDEPFGKITFSGGIADVFAHPSRSEALRAADQALYAAKNAGRNRVEIASA